MSFGVPSDGEALVAEVIDILHGVANHRGLVVLSLLIIPVSGLEDGGDGSLGALGAALHEVCVGPQREAWVGVAEVPLTALIVSPSCGAALAKKWRSAWHPFSRRSGTLARTSAGRHRNVLKQLRPSAFFSREVRSSEAVVGFPSRTIHGSVTSTGGQAVMWVVIASATASGGGTLRVLRPLGSPKTCLLPGRSFTCRRT